LTGAVGFRVDRSVPPGSGLFHLCAILPLMRKVVAYIDGFNLYHAIDHMKWLDLKALAASICGGNETLVATNISTALSRTQVQIFSDIMAANSAAIRFTRYRWVE
jgi:hypothetical protein